MKVLFRILMSLSYLLFAILLYVVVLSQNGKKGFTIAFAIDVLLILLIGISIYGMFKGSITILKIKQRKGSILLFALSIFFLFYVSALGVLSIILKENGNKEIPSLTESVLAVTNIFIPVGYKEGLLTEKFRGITFRFPKGKEASIHTIKSLYPKAKEELDKIYGKESSDHLTIMIYESADEFNFHINNEQLSGFYLSGNRSIHLVSDNKKMAPIQLQDSFIHEYAHYRTDQFLKQHNIPIRRIPQWFNEGISKFVADMHTYVDIDLIKVINFTDMDTNADFHKVNHGDLDPYNQSYFAVKELVLEHGMDVIPNLLRSSKDQNFYSAFQDITGIKIEEFQTTFLNRKEKIKVLFNQADEAEKKKQYKNAENLYLEINRLDPYSKAADQMLPYLYIKQLEFEKARDQLKALDELNVSDLTMLSELSLLKSPQEALKYAKKADEEIKINTGDDHYISDFADAVRVTIKEPVTGYIMLFDKNLITYKEIQTELYKKLKQLYPNDPRIQGLINK
jgi:hypothetical protein